MRLAGVPVSGSRQEHAGLDLPEPVEHAVDPEVGRARRPDGADARGGQHHDHRFGHVGHEARHAVAGRDAVGAERGRGTRHRVVQLVVREGGAPAVLPPTHERGMRVSMAEEILGEVELGAEKPGGPEIGSGRCDPFAPGEHRVPRAVAGNLVGDHVAETPDRNPEFLTPIHRPGIQRRVVADRRALVPNEADEASEVGARDRVGVGSPDGVRHDGEPNDTR